MTPKKNISACFPDKKRIKVILLFTITVFALIIRLHPSQHERIRYGFGQFGDSLQYHNIAYNICHGNGFSATADERAYGLQAFEKLNYEPAATRAPVYPLFLCMVYKLSGKKTSLNDWYKSWDTVRMVQSILDSLLCILVYFIVRMIIPDSSIPAFTASFLYALSVYNIFYARALLTESLTAFFLTCFLFLILLSFKSLPDKNKWTVAAGILLGIGVLTRPEYLLFIPFFGLFIYYCFRNNGNAAIQTTVIFLLASAMIILPWTARNYVVFKKPIIVAVSGLGYNLFLGTFEANNNFQGRGKYPEGVFTEKQKKQIINLRNQYSENFHAGRIETKKIDKVFRKIALSRIKEHPFQTFMLWLKGLPRLWYQNYIQMDTIPEPSGGYFRFYFLFALVAIFTGKKRAQKMMMPIVFLFLYISIVFLPLHIEPRYGVPVMPGIICLAGIGIWKLAKKINEWIYLYKNR